MLNFFSQRERRRRSAENVQTPAANDPRTKSLGEAQRTGNRVPGDAFPGAYGSGVSAHTVAAGGRRERYRGLVEFWIRETAVRLNQLSYDWAFLEPEPKRFNFDVVKRHIEPWAKGDKKVWIEISTTNKRAAPPRGFDQGLPRWVREAVPTIQSNRGGQWNRGTAVYPVPWDAEFQKRWFELLTAFARQFDGNTSIEMIATGGYGPGHEPRGPLGPDVRNVDLVGQLRERYGYDGDGPDSIWWNRAFVPIVSSYKEIFPRTRIAQTAVVRGAISEPLWQLCGGEHLDYVMLNNGFNYQRAGTTARRQWRENSLRFAADVGYAEWGPKGLGNLSLEKIYEGAIGPKDDPSRLSYLPLAHQRVTPETPQGVAAVAWADKHLRNWKR